MREVETDILADAILDVAAALNRIADNIERLGLNNASSPMGALELVAFEIKKLREKYENSRGED